MPTYTEVLQFEESAPAGTIRLVKSGEFYRAYNRSAWLFCSCVAEYRVMRKYMKSLKQNIYYIGFPEKSLLNNIGKRDSRKTDYGFDVTLSEQETPDEEGYESWKASVPVEESSKGDFHSLPLAGIDAEREVIKRIREFPIENRSLIECTVFLTELRKLLSNK